MSGNNLNGKSYEFWISPTSEFLEMICDLIQRIRWQCYIQITQLDNTLYQELEKRHTQGTSVAAAATTTTTIIIIVALT